jgi:hypothetical protein
MATIQTSNLRDRIKGDTFSSVNFTFLDSLGDPIDLTDATIRIMFRYRCNTGAVVKTMSIGSGLTVASPTSGVVTLNAFTPITFEVDTYYYDVEITFDDGTIKTYVKGTFKVLQDITNG